MKEEKAKLHFYYEYTVFLIKGTILSRLTFRFPSIYGVVQPPQYQRLSFTLGPHFTTRKAVDLSSMVFAVKIIILNTNIPVFLVSRFVCSARFYHNRARVRVRGSIRNYKNDDPVEL